MSSRNRIFGVVSTKDSRQFTPVAIRSFLRHTQLNLGDKLVLIDNDNSLSASDYPTTGPGFEIRTNSTPRGFSGNFNSLIDDAVKQSADLFLLNNDIVLVQDWLTPHLAVTNAITSSLSNREIAYVTSVANMKGEIRDAMVADSTMTLEGYLQSPQAFDYVAGVHRRHGEINIPTYFAPFFCTRIPFEILSVVGRLDESIGPAGGEDFDYCIRAHLAGFEIVFVAQSYVLHFGGQSTWNGPEASEARAHREEHFKRNFMTKWGERLFTLAFDPENSAVFTDPLVIQLDREKKLGEVIKQLAPATLPPITRT